VEQTPWKGVLKCGIMEFGGPFVMMTLQFLLLVSSVAHWDLVAQQRQRKMGFLVLEKVRSGWISCIVWAMKQE
jgi:hypothetical protein